MTESRVEREQGKGKERRVERGGAKKRSRL